MSTAIETEETSALKLLRYFAYFICLSILTLIFLGGQVKSNDAGLAVPDWPMTFEQNPITFPVSEWKEGIFHEHFHRLVAGGVAMLSLIFACLALYLKAEKWVVVLSWVSVVAVLAQALLGGLTVIYLLPLWASGSHAVLAQTYLVINVIIAYGLSKEYRRRVAKVAKGESETGNPVYAIALVLIGLVYVQLILGGLTRHTESALAIPDFPTMGGQIIPRFDEAMLKNINDWRFFKTDQQGLTFGDVEMHQVVLHFLHRLGALIVSLFVLFSAYRAYKLEATHPTLFLTGLMLCVVVLAQFMLGVMVVLTVRVPIITSLHVAIGALLLGLAVLFALRARPLQTQEAAAYNPALQTQP